MKALYKVKNGVFYKIEIKPCNKVISLIKSKYNEKLSKWEQTGRRNFDMIESKDEEIKNAYAHASLMGYAEKEVIIKQIKKYQDWFNLFERATKWRNHK